MTTSTQVVGSPVAMSIFFVRSLRSSAIDQREHRHTAAPEHALEHGHGSYLERHRLEEEHHLEPLAVHAREAEQDEPDDLRGGEGEPCSREDSTLLLVQALEVLLPVHAVVEPVQDQEEDADGDERDDRLQLLAVDREQTSARSVRPPTSVRSRRARARRRRTSAAGNGAAHRQGLP